LRLRVGRHEGAQVRVDALRGRDEALQELGQGLLAASRGGRGGACEGGRRRAAETAAAAYLRIKLFRVPGKPFYVFVDAETVNKEGCWSHRSRRRFTVLSFIVRRDSAGREMRFDNLALYLSNYRFAE